MSRFVEELRRFCGMTPSLADIDRRLTAKSGLPVIYLSDLAPDIVSLNRRIELLIAAGNLPALAEFGENSVKSRLRLSNGRSVSETVLDALLAPIHTADEPQECEQALCAYERWWQQDRGDSVAAGIYGQALALTGYCFRGDGWTNTVSDGQWAMLRHYVNRAQAVLDRASAGRDACWIWNRSKFQVQFVAYGVGEATAHDVTAAFDATRRLDPLEVSLYEDRVVQLLPRWGGSFDALEQLARQSYAATHFDFGAEMYARIYDCVARYEDVQDSLMDYYLARDGFWDWVNRVPSQSLANRFAAHAHLAGDVATLSRLFEQTITEIHPQHWFDIRQPLLAWDRVTRAHLSRH